MCLNWKAVERWHETDSLPPILPWILWITLGIACLLLFSRLGHYALWDDEAIDGLMGIGVLQTGDTTGVIGHNVIGYENGLLLYNLRVEGEPPFTAFATAASMKIFGESAWAARLPFALFGLAAVALMLWWILKLRPLPLVAATFAIGLLCNVSFFLYSRQCHYYGVAVFCFVAIPFVYFNWRGNKMMLAFMGVCSALLLAANYSFLIVLYGCLFADYMIWQRKVRKFGLTDILIIFAPPLLMGLVLMAWWNPFHTHLGNRLAHDKIAQRLTLFCWHWRDLNRCEMFAGLLLLLAPAVAFVRKDAWLKRALFALGLYTVGMTVLSTQTVTDSSYSEVRYFSGLIPLFIFIEVLTIRNLMANASWLSIPVALVAFGTNFLNGTMFFPPNVLLPETKTMPFRYSAIASYVSELANPPADPYSVTAKWINENVRENDSIWILPGYMNYPLMFHAPKAVYAWQLTWPPEQQFEELPPIHFQGREPPDYIIAFGPWAQTVRQLISNWEGIRYEPVAMLDCFWLDSFRPELFWRTFRTIPVSDKETDAIYVFKRKRN